MHCTSNIDMYFLKHGDEFFIFFALRFFKHPLWRYGYPFPVQNEMHNAYITSFVERGMGYLLSLHNKCERPLFVICCVASAISFTCSFARAGFTPDRVAFLRLSFTMSRDRICITVHVAYITSARHNFAIWTNGYILTKVLFSLVIYAKKKESTKFYVSFILPNCLSVSLRSKFICKVL